MEMMRGRAKQKHQVATGQLPMAPASQCPCWSPARRPHWWRTVQQAEEVERGVQGLGMSAWWNGVMTVRQLTDTDEVVIFTGDNPGNDPAAEVD